MRIRYAILAVISVVVALGCFRLSKWQLDRLAQRRERNAMLSAKLQAPPVALAAAAGDSLGDYRSVTFSGVLDSEREFALALRARSGSPGVYIITPMRLADGSTALVNRGWVYAPDGMSADLSKWREGATMTGQGFLEAFAEPRGPVALPDRPGLVRRLVRDSLAARLGERSLFPFIVVVTQPAASTAPARLQPPEISEGPHMSYAIQWGAFGVIALAGTILAVRRGVTEQRSRSVAPPLTGA